MTFVKENKINQVEVVSQKVELQRFFCVTFFKTCFDYLEEKNDYN